MKHDKKVSMSVRDFPSAILKNKLTITAKMLNLTVGELLYEVIYEWFRVHDNELYVLSGSEIYTDKLKHNKNSRLATKTYNESIGDEND